MILTAYDKCPKCGGVYVKEFNCSTSEKANYCMRCGKSEEFYIVTNDDGEPVLDEKGKPKYSKEIHDGYGCFYITEGNDRITNYIFDEPMDLKEAKKICLELCEGIIVDEFRSHFTYWDTEKKEIVVLFGYDPGTYEEYMDRMDDIPF